MELVLYEKDTVVACIQDGFYRTEMMLDQTSFNF